MAHLSSGWTVAHMKNQRPDHEDTAVDRTENEPAKSAPRRKSPTRTQLTPVKPSDSRSATNTSGQNPEKSPVTKRRPPQSEIVVRGARVHNLADIDVSFPKNSLIVCCGVSGSGKSSLAFDTIFAEGQRRYIESLSSYARQFLGQMDKPDVDTIEGLSPAVSIDQKSTSHNPRSTVGTVTEIWDHFRLLWARTGTPHCPSCGTVLQAWTASAVVDHLARERTGSELTVFAPIIRRRKGAHAERFEELAARGFSRVRIDGKIVRLDEIEPLDGRKPHDVDVVIDKITVNEERRARLLDAVELAFGLAEGMATIETGGDSLVYSTKLACAGCSTGFEVLEPRSFSFNSPLGACAVCAGLGSSSEPDTQLVISDETLSLADGAVTPWEDSSGAAHFQSAMRLVIAQHGGDMDTPWRSLPEHVRNVILNGDPDITLQAKFGQREYTTTYEGILPWLRRRMQEPWGEANRERMAAYFRPTPCVGCNGSRLNERARAVFVASMGIDTVSAMTVAEALSFFQSLELDERQNEIGGRLVKEIHARLSFLTQVGLGYLTLDRSASSLSGGEAQRIRLASQIGSGLTGVLYVLDEPSIGLHQRDNAALIKTLVHLRDLGNTVLVVEHDEDTIDAADWVVEIGPGAGEHGGKLVYSGPQDRFAKARGSVTADYLTGARHIDTPEQRRAGNGLEIVVRNVRANNLDGLDVTVPLGKFVAVTGVSGSGKSTLVNDVIATALSRRLNGAIVVPLPHDGIDGVEALDKIVIVDQSPIGRTPRSNPASYTGVFDHIRTLFSETLLARERGWKPGRFSFNVPAKNGGGRCETCQGQGTLTIEMSFLPDVHVPCESCDGQRFTRETLTVRYKDRSIADVLGMTVTEAVEFFEAVPVVKRHLQTLADVGLGYVRLGQTATTLSGGEAQRVKLASELLRRSTGKTVYILDEPTTGLHFDDVAKLLSVLERLVDAGNTVIVIEHNLDMVRRADWVIDLGPDGGPAGGQIVAQGTPEEVAKSGTSTGHYLDEALERAAVRQLNHPVLKKTGRNSR